MLFQEKLLLIISDDDEFVEVVKQLPYKIEVINDGIQLLNKQRPFLGVHIILFDVTTKNTDTDTVFHFLPLEVLLVLVGKQTDVDLIVRYIEIRKGFAVNYVLKPLPPILLRQTIENTYSGQELIEFMGFLASEFKNPLTSIKGYSDLLLTFPIDESQRASFFRRIKNVVLTIEKLMQNLVLAVRLERSRASLNFDDCPPLPVIQLAVREVEKRVPNKQHKLTINVPDDCPSVWADYNYLGILLETLVENAYLYTHSEGEVVISATPEGDNVKFAVQDSGIGIKDANKPEIFRLFFRAEDVEVMNHYGNGIGLYNARHIVSAHRGQIWFESETGKGSTFYFTIPIAPL
jgi:signal transduction histidine kinase